VEDAVAETRDGDEGIAASVRFFWWESQNSIEDDEDSGTEVPQPVELSIIVGDGDAEI
jgi:hypothetical protein